MAICDKPKEAAYPMHDGECRQGKREGCKHKEITISVCM